MNSRRLSLTMMIGGMLLTSHVQGHTVDAAIRHWEQASSDPDRIFLSFCGDPAASRAVTWRTDETVTSTRAEIAKTFVNASFAERASTFAAHTEQLDLNRSDVNLQGTVSYHSVKFDGLEPDTVYAYRVMGKEDQWSEWIPFRTAATNPAPFRFVYFGDAQNEILSHWSRVIRKAYETAPDAAFALYCGDLVNHGHHDLEWAEWFKAGGWIHAHWTGVPVVGNHEIQWLPNKSESERRQSVSLQWRPQFALPEEPSLPDNLQETVYTIDYQGVRVIVLNSVQGFQEQTAYLEEQLKRPGARWTVVACHYSLFSPRKGRDYQAQRDAWKPLLDRYGVDLVLQGHDHIYARGHVPVRSSEGQYGDSFQTLYITSMSGPKMYTEEPGKLDGYVDEGYRAGRTAEEMQFYQVITVDGGRLLYEAYTVDGALFDRVTIVKDLVSGAKRQEF